MKKFIKLLVIILIFISFFSFRGVCSEITGTVYLQEQSDHSGITVTLRESFSVPTMSLPAAAAILFLLGILIWRHQRGTGMFILFLAGVLGSAYVISADPLPSVMTGPDGSFIFSDVNQGQYGIDAEKACFRAEVIDPVVVNDEDSQLEAITLELVEEWNEAAARDHLAEISAAQTVYHKQSYPHTYTGDIACLASGNGAWGWDFIPEELADGEADGYMYQLAIGDFDLNGSYWAWSATAFPVSYGCSGTNSYYIDDVQCPGTIIQAGDIGGGPADNTLPYTCSGNKEENIYYSLEAIIQAQQDYFEYSYPHTYTAPLSNLVAGIGYPFLCSYFADNFACDYHFDLACGDPDPEGTIWTWSCTAWPVSYGGDTVRSFYVDEHRVIRGADIGGIPGDEALPEFCDYIHKESHARRILEEIHSAQMKYNNNASPHTYTGDLSCLASGNGGGGHPLVNGGVADGMYCGYNYAMDVGAPDPNDSYWTWSCTAWPVSHGGDSVRTFYMDETGFIRGSDTAGAPGDIGLPFLCEDESEHDTGINHCLSIAAGQTYYNNNSSPHTYTGDISCLASGNGAGGVSFISPQLSDGTGCYYVYQLGTGEPDLNGAIWSWSCTAWPIVYDSDSCGTFYIDETHVLRGSDLGGDPGDHTMPSIY